MMAALLPGGMVMDRELLEWAAKAAELPECGWMAGTFMYVKDNTLTPWNPLTDDGDALRLAVRLGLEMGFKRSGHGVWVNQPWRDVQAMEDATMGYSIEEATRRAITRAAAEIGKATASAGEGWKA